MTTRALLATCAAAAACASACVPSLALGGAPCADGACLDGFRCCNGECLAESEPCLGDCLAPSSGPATDRFMPHIPGATWVYEVLDAEDGRLKAIKHVRMGAEEDFSPVLAGRSSAPDFNAHRVCREDRTVDDVVMRGVIRAQRDTDDGALWLRNLRIEAGTVTDEILDAAQVRLDERPEHLCVGALFDASWISRTCKYSVDAPNEACERGEREVRERWRVDSIAEGIDVPGRGIVPGLRVTRLTDIGGNSIDATSFTFVRGIGKVAEVNDVDERERLIFYDVGGRSGGANPGAPMPPCTRTWRPRFE